MCSAKIRCGKVVVVACVGIALVFVSASLPLGAARQPEYFCVAGKKWTAREGVSPAVAREYGVGESFARANQALFGREDLQHVLILEAHPVNQQELDQQGLSWSIVIERASDASRRSWFRRLLVPRYDAFLVERTGHDCHPVGDEELYFANPAQQSGGDADSVQFAVESSDFVAAFSELEASDPE